MCHSYVRQFFGDCAATFVLFVIAPHRRCDFSEAWSHVVAIDIFIQDVKNVVSSELYFVTTQQNNSKSAQNSAKYSCLLVLRDSDLQ